MFETADGEPIFPESEEPWWLTDVSRKIAQEEEVDGDEDGPASDDLEGEQQAEVSDSDADSGEVRVGPSSSSHEPYLGWRR